MADLSHYDEVKHTYNIPKFNEFKYEVDKCYLIHLDKSLLINDPNSLLISNWNKGSVPPSEYMKVDVSKILGKMIYINGLGYNPDTNEDYDDVWSGWLPTSLIEMISLL